MELRCRQRVDVEEYIDSPETSLDDIRDTMRDQALVNRRLGGADATLSHVLPMLKSSTSDPIRILDAACGGGDLSRRIVDEARRLARCVKVTALDLNVKVIECARQAPDDYPEISFVHGDALHPPFEPGEFDVVIVATFLHHLPPHEVIAALQAARKLSKSAVVAADLVRSPWAWLGIHIFARLARFNPVSAHDGAVSVRRAYTPTELAELARQAGLTPSRIYRHRFYRMTLVYDGDRLGGE
jgi:2-polyprenyl-3-methyl-5-hydroxy-6-metoxy-1,4-benzoquinol methylase